MIKWRYFFPFILARSIDEPNEADVVVVDFYGIGWTNWSGWFIGHRREFI